MSATASTLNFTMTGLSRGITYYFKVTAWNIIGESASSVESYILAATVPIAVVQPVISVQTSTTITITWTEPDNGGSAVDDY
jgi:hypothetical protein